jgi:hypothetical protein
MTHRENVLRKLGLSDKPYSLAFLAKASKIPLGILKEVEKRGFGAYRTQPSSVRMAGTFEKGVNALMKYKLSPFQWARARVYSFIDGNPKHDSDLRNKM